MIPLNVLIEGLISEIAGKDVVPLVDLLWNKRDVSEFKLADKLKITINQIRNMLYKLNSNSLVDFTRKKDKKKGWYIYYWTLDILKSLQLMIDLKKEKMNFLKEKLEKRQFETYFTCPNKCLTLKYNNAMEHDFKCYECGEILEAMDMKKQINMIKKKIKVLEEEIKDAEEYLKKETERVEKKKAKAEGKSKPKKKKIKKKFKKKAKKKKIKKRKKKGRR